VPLSFAQSRWLSLLPLLISLLVPHAAQAQAATPDPAADLLQQGHDDLLRQRYQDAMKAFKKANQLRHGTCADCYFEMAVALTRTGEFDEALKSCDKAISCATTDLVRTSSHTLKGNILQNMADDPKKLKAAEAEYRAALALDTNSANAHLNLGVVLLRESLVAEGIEELKNYLRLAPDGPDANYATKLIAFPKKAGLPLAPNFEVRTLDGQDVSLHQLAGRIVVMDFWATWCPPCVSSVPELKNLTKKYSREQLVLISFSADDDESSWRSFVAKKNMDWAQYWDHDGRIRNEFGVHAFPTYLVIDPDGFIHERIVGLDPQKTVVARLKDTLQTMLPEK